MKQLLLFTLLCLLSIFLRVNAQPGILDNTFGSGGLVTTFFTGHVAYHISSALDSNGRTILAGSLSNGVNETSIGIARYNSDGMLDSSFDNDGRARNLPAGCSDVDVEDVAVQPDGKIIVTGWCVQEDTIPLHYDFLTARYNIDGTVDSSFGDYGRVITHPGSNGGMANCIKLQPDDKILVGGRANNLFYTFALARYNADGTLDSDFGIDGIVVTTISPTLNYAIQSIALQPDGKMVCAGSSYSFNNPNNEFEIVRYNTNGIIDSTFGNNGIVSTVIGIKDVNCNDVVVQPDGKILAAGDYFIGGLFESDIFLGRFLAAGMPDTDFGDSGIVIKDLAGYTDECFSILLQPDNKILAAGYAIIASGPSDFALCRFKPDGDIDSTFGSSGIVLTDFNSVPDLATDMLLQTDGKVVLSGTTGYAFASARYLLDLPTETVSNFTSTKYNLYPNPFSDALTIQFSLPENSIVTIELLDISGRKIKIVEEGFFSAGDHQLNFSGIGLTKGIYFLKLKTDDSFLTQKVVVN